MEWLKELQGRHTSEYVHAGICLSCRRGESGCKSGRFRNNCPYYMDNTPTKEEYLEQYADLVQKMFMAEGEPARGDLYGADLRGAKNIPFIPYACPDFGMFIGFKKARDNLIVVLEIPDDAKRLSATGRKCRCDKARVLEIQNLDGTKSDKIEAVSQYDEDFIYRVGEIISVPDFCEDRWNECSEGIHFFINRQEAVDY